MQIGYLVTVILAAAATALVTASRTSPELALAAVSVVGLVVIARRGSAARLMVDAALPPPSSQWRWSGGLHGLRPQAGPDGHLADTASAIAWARRHAGELGADPGPVVAVGRSAGAHMAAILGLGGHDVSAVVGCCDYGTYHGAEPDLPAPLLLVRPDARPFLIVDGDRGTFLQSKHFEPFVSRLREVSMGPVVHIVLPGAQHDFDLWGTVRFEAFIVATQRFLDQDVEASPPRTAQT